MIDRNRSLYRFANRHGFGLLETIIGVFLFTAIAIWMTRLYTTSNQAVVNRRTNQRAITLSDMVLEQYDAYVSAPTLSNYDVTRVQPKQFFGTADNLGFDNYLITTRATYGLGVEAQVAVTLNWREGGKNLSKIFTKSYSTLTRQRVGASLDVWVKAPCGPAAVDDIIATCPGLGGFEISASSGADPNARNNRGGSEVIGYTDRNGHVLLRGVAVAAALTVSAKKPGSSLFSSTDTFSQGYYVAGSTSSVLSQNVATTGSWDHRLLFKSFLPLGSVQGRLANTSGGPVSGMMVLFNGYASTGLGLQTNPTWNVLTDVNGDFIFSNVLPGNVSLRAAGDPGSHYSITPADPEFRWGYSNPSPYNTVLATPANALAAPTFVTQNVQVTRMGWLRLTTLRPPPISTPVGTDVQTRLPATIFRYAVPATVHTDNATGTASLFNVFDTPATPMTFSGSKAGVGYFSNLSLAGGIDQENDVTLTMEQMYHLQGNVQNLFTGLGMAQQLIVSAVQDGPTATVTVLAGGTFFDIPDFRANDPVNPGANKVILQLTTNPALTVTVGLSGTYQDAVTGRVLGNIPIQVRNDQSGVPLTSAGAVTFPSVPIKWVQNVAADISCNIGSHLCTLISTILVDPSAATAGLYIPPTPAWGSADPLMQFALQNPSFAGAPSYTVQVHDGATTPGISLLLEQNRLAYVGSSHLNMASGILGGIRMCDGNWIFPFANAMGQPLNPCILSGTLTGAGPANELLTHRWGAKLYHNAGPFPVTGYGSIIIPEYQRANNGLIYSGNGASPILAQDPPLPFNNAGDFYVWQIQGGI